MPRQDGNLEQPRKAFPMFAPFLAVLFIIGAPHRWQEGNEISIGICLGGVPGVVLYF